LYPLKEEYEISGIQGGMEKNGKGMRNLLAQTVGYDS
jgi:hypothetical protein